MKIMCSTVDFATAHLATQETKISEKLEATRSSPHSATPSSVTMTRETTQASMRASAMNGKTIMAPTLTPSAGIFAETPGNPASVRSQISDAGQQSLQADQARGANRLNRQINNDPDLSLLKQAIEMLTGKKIHLVEYSGASPQNVATTGSVYQRSAEYTETEQSAFSASGTVKTADGREISFQLNHYMSRYYHEESFTEIRRGSALSDPLVLNFAGNAAELSNSYFRFEAEIDVEEGEATPRADAGTLRALMPGSGYLVFDRNGDGKVNGDSELFGATTGDGFAELAALDEDANGWIDENDSAFESLYVWTKAPDGNDRLQTLKEANVGAILLAHADTPFSLKDAANNLTGQIRETGVFLKENGGVGSVQKIDLVV